MPYVSSGHLRKKSSKVHLSRSKGVKQWQRRFFALDRARRLLLYYDVDELEKLGWRGGLLPKEGVTTIDLREVWMVNVTEPRKHQGRGIKVVTAERAYYLLAESRVEALGWVAAIERAGVGRDGGGGGAPPTSPPVSAGAAASPMADIAQSAQGEPQPASSPATEAAADGEQEAPGAAESEQEKALRVRKSSQSSDGASSTVQLPRFVNDFALGEPIWRGRDASSAVATHFESGRQAREHSYLWTSVDPTLPYPLPCYDPLTRIRAADRAGVLARRLDAGAGRKVPAGGGARGGRARPPRRILRHL